MSLSRSLRIVQALLAFLLCVGLLAAAPSQAEPYQVANVPNPRAHGPGHVANPDRVLSEPVQRDLDAMLARLERDTGVQVAVVAVRQIDAATEVDFAQGLFDHWRIGQHGHDNGLLILLVTDRHVVRLHTGYGLEATLPDLICRQIQEQHMLPHFKHGDFDAGMLAGVHQVVGRLRDAAQGAAPGAAADRALAQRKFLRRWAAPGLALLGLLGFVALSLGGHFKGRAAPSPMAKGMRRGRASWLAVYLVVPVALVLAAAELSTSRPLVLAATLLYGHGLLLTLDRWWRQRRLLAQRSEANDHAGAARWLMAQRVHWWLLALLFPLPMAAVALRLPAMIRHYRAHPRACVTCGGTARLLTEADEDAHLAAGQQTEEAIHSLEHDVWWCDGCHSACVLSFEGSASRFSRCRECGFKTRHQTEDRVLVAATEQATGHGERHWTCAHCAHASVEPYSIARLSSSDSAPSDGGSSTTGSWGGGSSGGGGASAHW